MPPSSSTTSGKGVVGGIDTNVGKVASALLAKHVRTLEILHSLQMDNAQLRLEIQVSVVAPAPIIESSSNAWAIILSVSSDVDIRGTDSRQLDSK